MKKEGKMIAPDYIMPEEPKQTIVMIENKKTKSRLIDHVKFGVGIYIGYKVAKAAADALVKAISKK